MEKEMRVPMEILSITTLVVIIAGSLFLMICAILGVAAEGFVAGLPGMLFSSVLAVCAAKNVFHRRVQFFGFLVVNEVGVRVEYFNKTFCQLSWGEIAEIGIDYVSVILLDAERETENFRVYFSRKPQNLKMGLTSYEKAIKKLGTNQNTICCHLFKNDIKELLTFVPIENHVRYLGNCNSIRR